MINNNEDLQRYLFLFICGNYSRILSSVHYEPGMYDGARDMIPVIAQTLRQLSHETTTIPLLPGI